MPIAIQCSDGSGSGPNFKDIDGSANNFVYTTSRLVFSGAYPAGGDALDLTPLVAAGVDSSFVPLSGYVESNGAAGVGAAAGSYALLQNATPTLKNFLVKVFTAGTSELSGNYTSTETADNVTLVLIWRKAQ